MHGYHLISIIVSQDSWTAPLVSYLCSYLAFVYLDPFLMWNLPPVPENQTVLFGILQDYKRSGR